MTLKESCNNTYLITKLQVKQINFKSNAQTKPSLTHNQTNQVQKSFETIDKSWSNPVA